MTDVETTALAMAAADARIEALEAACAHQDRTIAELSDAVAAQWARIEALTREVLRLREELQGLSATLAPDRPPPHY
jgi:SlyX protein